MAKRRQLTRVKVVEKAAEMANTAGTVEAVTLTALAEALDIRVPSLYNHVNNLADLTTAMAVFGARQLITALRRTTAGQVGRDALVAMAGAYRDFARQHPGIYPLIIRAPDPGEAELTALSEELLQMLLLVLASLGVFGDDAYHAIRGFRSVLHGFVSLESAGGFKMTLDKDESFQRLVTAYIDGIPAGRQPE